MRGLEELLSTRTSLLLDENAVESELEAKTLGELRSSKATVYDFWTTRCTNCPAALDSLDAIAKQRPSVTFVGVNIDDAAAAKEIVSNATSQGRWTRLLKEEAYLKKETPRSILFRVTGAYPLTTDLIMRANDDKEKAKNILGMRTVPFYVVVGQEGRVLRHGNAKALPLKSAESLDAILLQEAPDKQNENDPAVANAPPGAAAHAAAACPTSGTNTQAGEGEGETAVAVAVAVAAATAAAAPSPPAAPTRGMDCEGGVCKLVRKKKASATPEQAPTSDGTQEAKTADAAAAPASAPAPARAMDCEGGVCKLVRKNKTPAAPGAAAAAAAPQSAEGGVPEEPLGVGGVMPSLRVVRIDDGRVTTLDEIRAGGRAVLDFWTTRCVRCPAALDALEELAAAAATTAEGSRVTYISINLDSLEKAKEIVGKGNWPSITHVYAGRDEDSEALEKFKSRAGVKSVPFYVVVAGGGEMGEGKGKGLIEQIGGPKAVNLEKMRLSPPEDSNAATAAAAAAAAAASHAAAAAAPKASAFTMDEDF